MIYWLGWYLLISLAGWLAFPLAARFLGGLPDRGLAFSRALGLLLWGYLYWISGSLHLHGNDAGGMLAALAGLGLLSAWALRGGRLAELGGWLRRRLSLVITIELIFLIGFLGWAVVRAANPEIAGTEKPMELAFINAVLRSDTQPPHDPWLSGYGISYYHFGYILTGVLATLTGAPGGSAFNLMLALVFGLVATGSYGMVYNLLAANGRSPRWALFAGLLGPLFVLLIGNFEGVLHVLHTRGLFWAVGADGQLQSGFWRWLDMNELSHPPEQPFGWAPTRFWWWWRASRVITDTTLGGAPLEIINEFPFFSFLLGDLHPHVLAAPFVFLAMALGLNVHLAGGQGRLDWLRRSFPARWGVIGAALLAAAGIAFLVWGAIELNLGRLTIGLGLLAVGGVAIAGLALRPSAGSSLTGPEVGLSALELLFAGVILGGVAFLNTWDFPIYAALFAGAYALRRMAAGGLWAALVDFAVAGVLVGAAGVLLYLPFYLGFASQAGGLIPNLIYPTRGAHLWVMFFTLWLPLGAYLVYLYRRSGRLADLGRGVGVALGLSVAGWLLALLVGAAATLVPQSSAAFLGALGASSAGELFSQAVLRRLVNLGGLLSIVLLLGAAIGLLFTRRMAGAEKPSLAQTFLLWMVLLGGLLVFFPEFFYLRDHFGWRINTIFKFYFQAWMLFGVAAAAGTALLLSQARRWAGVLAQVVIVIAIGSGLVYAPLSLWNKTGGFAVMEWSLDGAAYLARQNPDEAAAVEWLRQAPIGALAEAVSYEGGSYSGYARISMLSGQPAVLGWMGHEDQWRGGSQAMGTRQADIARLYCSRDWETARAILEQYDIRYVFLGGLERITYTPGKPECPGGLYEPLFERFLTPVFRQGDAAVYQVP